MPDKDTIFKQLRETRVEIGLKFDISCNEEFSEIAEELALAYSQLLNMINIEDQSKINDNDFLAATLLWTSCNTILAGLDLFRAGYSKEHLMLLRNSLEIISSAYAVHGSDKEYLTMRDNPKKFDSTKHIALAKDVFPLVGRMYGLLSDGFTHVSAFHTVPHRVAPFCIGGLYDEDSQKDNPLALSMFLTTAEILNGFIELIFARRMSAFRFWEVVDQNNLKYKPIPEIKTRQESMIIKVGNSINGME